MGYQFNDNKKQVNIEIADHKFCVVYNVELLKNVNKTGNAAIEYAESDAFIKDSAENMAYFVYDLIDQILGEGSSDTIFEGREPDYFEATDVYGYIVKEIENAGHNRKQRRAVVSTSAKKKRKHYNGNHA